MRPGYRLGINSNMKRMAWLDGLRGLACLQVVVEHYCFAFAPTQIASLGFLSAGDSAVFLFFLMSGFVLTGSFESSTGAPLTSIQRRIVRLGVPAFAALSVAVLLESVGLPVARRAVALAGGVTTAPYLVAPLSGWKGDFSGLTLFFGFSQDSIFPWAGLPSRFTSLNPTLWTISAEFWGSLWVLLLVWLRRRSPAVYMAMLGASIFLIGTHEIALFTVGHLCARRRNDHDHMVFGFVSIIFGAILCDRQAVPLIWASSYFLPHGWLHHSTSGFAWQNELGATLIFLGVLSVPAGQSLLSRRIPQYIGRLSFSVYLIHWPILLVAGSTVFLVAHPLGQLTAAALAFAIGLALTLGLAAWFEQYIDAPAVRLSRRLKLPFLRRAETPAAP